MIAAALSLDSVSKEFRLYPTHHAGLKELIVNPFRKKRSRQTNAFLAISDISLAVGKGESFGILGRNGAGKSTLLALIAGVLRPTSGTISVRGRISPLLELGVGFTHELTGRENIIINGVLLGLRKREIEAKVEQIIEFAELSKFIDQPLKTFSSGMLSRLGFAIAVQVKPDIVLIDEVLSVGDANFQKKCLRRIDDLRNNGVTIVFVSHNLDVVESVCDRVVWIDKGQIIAIGPSKDVVAAYRIDMHSLQR